MTFQAKAIALFPGVQFTGGSDIHASKAVICTSQGVESNRQLLKLADSTKLYMNVALDLCNTFPGFEWLLSPTDIQTLLIVDLYHLCIGEPAKVTKGMLKNPMTGNVFHQIGLFSKENIVGGIRTAPELTYQDGKCVPGVLHRFRLQTLKSLGETEASVRERATRRLRECEEEMEDIAAYIAQTPALTEDAQLVNAYNQLH